jgi:hypothetical protein
MGNGLVAVAKKKPAKNTPVRLTDDAIEWAKIASGYTGETVPDYVSRVISERGRLDAEKLHAAKMKAERPPNRAN